MSTELRAKRGASGQKNAESKPFRSNGRQPDWALHSAGVYTTGARHIGAHMARAAIGAVLVQRLGFCGSYIPSVRLDELMSRSLERCPVAGTVFDAIGVEAAPVQAGSTGEVA